ILRRWADVLAAARVAASTITPRPLRHVTVEGDIYSGGRVLFRIPVNERLEKLAQFWATSGRQEQAIQALRYFPTRENAAILRKMVGDERSSPVYSIGHG